MKIRTEEGQEVHLGDGLQLVEKDGSFRVEPIEMSHPSCGGDLCNDGTCHICFSGPTVVTGLDAELQITVGDLRRIGLPIFGKIPSSTILKELRVVPAPTVCDPDSEPKEINARLRLEFFMQPEAISLCVTVE